MTYEKLKKEGMLIASKDVYDGGIYLFMWEGWIYENDFYFHEEHANTNRYTGKTCTYRVCSFDSKEFPGYLWACCGGFFHSEDLTEKGKQFLSEKGLENC